MLDKTKGIVLRKVQYGDTSLIVSVFTERFGLQSYMMKGVRRGKSGKANLLFPSSLLDLVVYHQAQKNLQSVREFQPAYFFRELGVHVIKNGIAVFAMEVLAQLLLTGDVQESLFRFTEAFLLELDQVDHNLLANFPLFFLIEAGRLSGYRLSGRYCNETPFLDLQEGCFSAREAFFPPFISPEDAFVISLLNASGTLEKAKEIRMSNMQRRQVLGYFMEFFRLHLPRFKHLQSAEILSAVLS